MGKVACKTKNDNKKIRVGDLNLGTVGNRKHTYFFVWPKVFPIVIGTTITYGISVDGEFKSTRDVALRPAQQPRLENRSALIGKASFWTLGEKRFKFDVLTNANTRCGIFANAVLLAI